MSTTIAETKIRIPSDQEDAAIMAAALSDPDALPWTDEELNAAAPSMRIGLRPVGRPRVEIKRPSLNMRIDADVLERLRASGRGWQTRVNTLLREAVETGRV